MSFIINNNFKRVDPEIISKYKDVSVSTLGHLRDYGFIKSLKPLFHPIKIVGSALTVRIPHLDSAAVHYSLKIAKPGDVLVISTSGDYERASVGGLVTYAAKKKGVSGIIVDGSICDYREIMALNFPVFSRGISPLTTRILGIEGAIGVEIAIDGVPINSGDLIFADDDGIVVLKNSEINDIWKLLAEKEAGEIGIKEKIDNGIDLADITNASKLIEGKI